ncbi:hypothetical protein HOY80DRAFT_1085643 [Tuber brumale]|nr:hypothetical protein HOY80DRAFT_1085643 [Tuber brumale]
MSHLTVGQVSGIINLWIIIVQLTLPLALVVILVALLENENNAVTWSVVGRALQASMWPSILSTDTAARRGVRKRVIFITTLSTITVIIIAIAGVVTPLGLNEGVTLSLTEPALFKSLRDTSEFGQGTQSRSGYLFSRMCGQLPIDCPGISSGSTYFTNETRGYTRGRGNGSTDTNIPQNISEIFKSGTDGHGNLISGPFDVQHRVFRNVKVSDVGTMYNEGIQINWGKAHTEGVGALLRSVILEDSFLLVEGLIVDAKNGGIGFRNHSAPPNLQYGKKWEESLLWVEPVTECVNNNLTIEFTIVEESDIDDARLTDHGGWVNLGYDRPNFNHSNSQVDIQLWQRAYKGAWLTNEIGAWFHNVTRNMTKLGKSYSLIQNEKVLTPSYPVSKIDIYNINGYWVEGNLQGVDTFSNYSAASIECQGSEPTDMANITNVAVKCSTIFGIAKRADGGDPARVHEIGSNWTIPIYTCATAIKASVKVVTFTMNGTHKLENLRVAKVTPKNYSEISLMPVWAVENTEMKIRDIEPFWGIVDPKYKKAPHLWTIQCEHLWLPSGGIALYGLGSSGSLGLLTVPVAALEGISTEDDYSGERNFPLLTKWRKLSATASSAALIPNLIWTDIVANNLVGTKGVPSADGVAGGHGKPSAGMLSVETYSKRITYDFRFAIPAFVVLAMWIASLFIALQMLIVSRVSLAVVRELINQTGTGRYVTNFLYPETCGESAPTKVWVSVAGKKNIGFVSFSRENSDECDSVGEEDGIMVEEGGDMGGMLKGETGLRFGKVEQDSARIPVAVVLQSRYSGKRQGFFLTDPRADKLARLPGSISPHAL